MTDQELLEADRCFQFVMENIRQDGVNPRQVLFGTTLRKWLEGKWKIYVVCNPPSSQYHRVELGKST